MVQTAYPTSALRSSSLKPRDIADLRHIHRGPVALLGNGQSLQRIDLHSIPCPLIGMNRTYKGYNEYNGPAVDYYCFIDPTWLKREGIHTSRNVINMSASRPDVGYVIRKSYESEPWSWDLARDGICHPNAGYASMQVAAYLGFTDLYLFGYDYAKPVRDFKIGLLRHFDNSPAGQGLQVQPQWFGKAREALQGSDVSVTFVGSDNGSTDFDNITFEEFCERV